MGRYSSTFDADIERLLLEKHTYAEICTCLHVSMTRVSRVAKRLKDEKQSTERAMTAARIESVAADEAAREHFLHIYNDCVTAMLSALSERTPAIDAMGRSVKFQNKLTKAYVIDRTRQVDRVADELSKLRLAAADLIAYFDGK